VRPRADRVIAHFAEAEIDLLLVAAPVNLRYLTGFTGSNGLAVLGPELRRFVTDFRYVAQAEAEVPEFEREQGPQDLLDALKDSWPDGPVRLGFDDANVSVRSHGRLRERLPERVELVPASGLVERVRAVKDPQEVDRIRAGAQLADTVLRELADEGLVGRTEREVAVALEHRMRVLGATGPSFPSIVASGPHGALPHAQPRDVEIVADTLVTLDLGAVLDGYASDCTRTWATGEALPEALAEIYAVCERAQADALAAVAPGAVGRAVDAVARDAIGAAGHGDRFGHGLGHGVGLEVHEAPRLSRVSEAVLERGNVVTVEPGIYLPGVGGVRIEDLVVVTAEAHEVLTHTPKALTVVG
jgi:Xaa-Pro aminopeptidase